MEAERRIQGMVSVVRGGFWSSFFIDLTSNFLPTSDEPVELRLEDIDINRHREITSKAVSAILILTLKWFKTSRECIVAQTADTKRAFLPDSTAVRADVMKFHYLSQLLVDSNCLLLILKMFGLQEVSTSVKTKHERPDQK